MGDIMTYREVKQRLDDWYAGEIVDISPEVLTCCYKAIEKQIPKKPTKLVSKLLIGAGWTYKCPTCGCACGENKYHLEVTQDDFYCTQCGQMLDWDN